MGSTSTLTHTPSPKTLKLTSKLTVESGAPEGSLYVSVRAISARVNRNYDGWPSQELRKAYQTFIGRPVFVNHVNHDHKRTRGIIVDSQYHEEDDDKYIRLLIEVDAVAFPKLAEEIRNGNLDSVSMGCDVEWTECSVCGNQAYSLSDFCDHVLHMKGQEVDGVLVYEKCYGLNFFEISFVFDPADETAVAQEVSTTRLSSVTSEVVAPQKVDTLREETVCPQCGDSTYDNKECKFCGYTEPIEGLGDPDLSKAQEKNREVYDDYEEREGREMTVGLPSALSSFRLSEARKELLRRKAEETNEEARKPEQSQDVETEGGAPSDEQVRNEPETVNVEQETDATGDGGGESQYDATEYDNQGGKNTEEYGESTDITLSSFVTRLLRSTSKTAGLPPGGEWQDLGEGRWRYDYEDSGDSPIYMIEATSEGFQSILELPAQGSKDIIGEGGTPEEAVLLFENVSDDHWKDLPPADASRGKEASSDLELLQQEPEWEELMEILYTDGDVGRQDEIFGILNDRLDISETDLWFAVGDQSQEDGKPLGDKFSKASRKKTSYFLAWEEEEEGVWVGTHNGEGLGEIYDEGGSFTLVLFPPRAGDQDMGEFSTLEAAQEFAEDHILYGEDPLWSYVSANQKSANSVRSAPSWNDLVDATRKMHEEQREDDPEVDRLVEQVAQESGVGIFEVFDELAGVAWENKWGRLTANRLSRKARRSKSMDRKGRRGRRMSSQKKTEEAKVPRQRKKAAWTQDGETWVLEDKSGSLQGLVLENSPGEFDAYTYDESGSETSLGSFPSIEEAKSAVDSGVGGRSISRRRVSDIQWDRMDDFAIMAWPFPEGSQDEAIEIFGDDDDGYRVNVRNVVDDKDLGEFNTLEEAKSAAEDYVGGRTSRLRRKAEDREDPASDRLEDPTPKVDPEEDGNLEDTVEVQVERQAKTASSKSVMMLVEAYLNAGLTTEAKKWDTYSELENYSQERVDDHLSLLSKLKDVRTSSTQTPRASVPRTARRGGRPNLSFAQRSSTGTPPVDDSLLFS